MHGKMVNKLAKALKKMAKKGPNRPNYDENRFLTDQLGPFAKPRRSTIKTQGAKRWPKYAENSPLATQIDTKYFFG